MRYNSQQERQSSNIVPLLQRPLVSHNQENFLFTKGITHTPYAIKPVFL